MHETSLTAEAGLHGRNILLCIDLYHMIHSNVPPFQVLQHGSEPLQYHIRTYTYTYVHSQHTDVRKLLVYEALMMVVLSFSVVRDFIVCTMPRDVRIVEKIQQPCIPSPLPLYLE